MVDGATLVGPHRQSEGSLAITSHISVSFVYREAAPKKEISQLREIVFIKVDPLKKFI